MLSDTEVDEGVEAGDGCALDDANEAKERDTSPSHPKNDELEKVDSDGGKVDWLRVVAYWMVPAVALLMLSAAAFLKWQDISAHRAKAAGEQAVVAATDGTIALLSYKPETVEQDLKDAQSRMTGDFLESYRSLTNDVVIPGAKQKQIAAEATVPAAAPVESTADHAVVLLFVNQTLTIGEDPPTNTGSSVRVSLDKVDGRWLISQFDPI